MCGPSEDPLCHDGHVRQEVKGLRECPEALGIFQMDLKNICKFWSLIKTHHFLVCNIINIMSYNGCLQMLHISLKTEKSFIAHPWCLLCVVGLEVYSAHDWRATTSDTACSSYLARMGPVFTPIWAPQELSTIPPPAHPSVSTSISPSILSDFFTQTLRGF